MALYPSTSLFPSESLFPGALVDPAAVKFPQTGILDDFNRPDEGPPPSSSWTSQWFDALYGQFQVVSGQLKATAQWASGYWSAQTFGPDCEMYITTAGTWTGSNDLALAMVEPGAIGTSGYDGYEVYITTTTWALRRTTNNSNTDLATGSFSTSLGDSFGLRRRVDQIEFWHKPVGGTWQLIQSFNDVTYSGPFHLCLYSEGGGSGVTQRFTNFGGGTLPEARPAPSVQDTLSNLVYTRMPGKEAWLVWSRYAMNSTLYTPALSPASGDGIWFNITHWDPLTSARPSAAEAFRITGVSGFEQAEVRERREVRPGNHGDIAYDAYLAGRNITLTGRIEAYSLPMLRYMQKRLKTECLGRQGLGLIQQRSTWQNFMGTLWVIDKDRSAILYAPGRVIDLRMSEVQKDGNFFRDFQIVVRLVRPFFTDYSGAVAAGLGGLTQIGSTTNLIGGTTSFTVSGNVNRDAVLVIGNYPTGSSSSISGNLTITNTTTGQTVVLSSPTWGLDEWWGVDSRDQHVALSNTKGPTNTKASSLVLTSTTAFIQLAPGTNTITRTGTVGSGTPKLAVFAWDEAHI